MRAKQRVGNKVNTFYAYEQGTSAHQRIIKGVPWSILGYRHGETAEKLYCDLWQLWQWHLHNVCWIVTLLA